MTWTLTHPAKATTVNKSRTEHFHTRAAHDREWRGVFWLLAMEAHVPPCEAIAVRVQQECRTRRLPDVAACLPSVKAAIDGLVDAGVIPDDDPAHMRRLVFEAPVTTGRDAITLEIEAL